MFLSSREKTIHTTHESTLIWKYNDSESTLATQRVHPYGFGPKEEIHRIFKLTAVCPFLDLNLEVYPFFSIRVELYPFMPLNCTLFWPKTYSLLRATQVEHSKYFSRNFLHFQNSIPRMFFFGNLRGVPVFGHGPFISAPGIPFFWGKISIQQGITRKALFPFPMMVS